MAVSLSTQLLPIRMANLAETCSMSYNKEKKKSEYQIKLQLDGKSETKELDLHSATGCCNIVLYLFNFSIYLYNFYTSYINSFLDEHLQNVIVLLLTEN
jgi:hypothetical protein